MGIKNVTDPLAVEAVAVIMNNDALDNDAKLELIEASLQYPTVSHLVLEVDKLTGVVQR